MIRDANAHGTATSPAETAGLVARARAGDADAFGSLYRRYVDRTFRYLRLRVGDGALAADITQDVWVDALTGIGAVTDPLRFDAWLFAVTRNRLRRHWARARRHPAPLDSDAGEDGGDGTDSMDVAMDGGTAIDPSLAGDGVEATTVGRWEIQSLVAAVATLSDRKRDVIALRFGADYSIKEVAALLDKSEAAVKQLQHRALVDLRALLHNGEGEP